MPHPVKSEPVSSGPDESTSLAPLYPDEEQYEDYPEEEHYAEDQYSQAHHSSGEVNKGKLMLSFTRLSFHSISQPFCTNFSRTKTKMKYSVKICASLKSCLTVLEPTST